MLLRIPLLTLARIHLLIECVTRSTLGGGSWILWSRQTLASVAALHVGTSLVFKTCVCPSCALIYVCKQRIDASLVSHESVAHCQITIIRLPEFNGPFKCYVTQWGCQISQKKSITKVYGSTLLALRGGGWGSKFQETVLRDTLMAPIPLDNVALSQFTHWH